MCLKSIQTQTGILKGQTPKCELECGISKQENTIPPAKASNSKHIASTIPVIPVLLWVQLLSQLDRPVELLPVDHRHVHQIWCLVNSEVTGPPEPRQLSMLNHACQDLSCLNESFCDFCRWADVRLFLIQDCQASEMLQRSHHVPPMPLAEPCPTAAKQTGDHGSFAKPDPCSSGLS